ncbi:MAG: 5'/3'-nucleotidase SurE [Clostridia bacterium]|nr:5'/3'-nucleotidase SurE [Clostridia bacterium]
MNILVCNDDGVFSEGIISLANILKKEHQITVVAPNGNRSGFSRSLTFYKDMSVEKVECVSGVECYALSGTPSDCVRFAVTQMNKKLDLVISGINNGSNLGSDIYYSGTVGACFEANTLDIPAIALSSVEVNPDFNKVAIEIEKLLPNLFSKLDKSVTFNVNVPTLKSKLNGVKYCFVGVNKYTDGYVETAKNVYQLIGKPIPPTENDFGSDVYYAHKGFITVTPLKCVLTDYSLLMELTK